MIKTKKIIDRFLLVLSSLLLTAMVVLSIWQVLARYVFSISSPGTEELTRYLLIWFGLMTAAYVFGANKHIGILFFREKLSSVGQKTLEIISDLLILFTAIFVMGYGGIKVVLLTQSQTAAATGISMAWVYGALPVSGLFILIYTIINMQIKKSDKKEVIQ